jgi:hypothetical protein
MSFEQRVVLMKPLSATEIRVLQGSPMASSHEPAAHHP